MGRIVIAFALALAAAAAVRAQDRDSRREEAYRKLHGEPVSTMQGGVSPSSLATVDQDVTIAGRVAADLHLRLRLTYQPAGGSKDPEDLLEQCTPVAVDAQGRFEVSFSTLTRRMFIARYALQEARLEIDTLYGRTDVRLTVAPESTPGATPLARVRRIALHRISSDDAPRLAPTIEVAGGIPAAPSQPSAPEGDAISPLLAIPVVDGHTSVALAVDWAE